MRCTWESGQRVQKCIGFDATEDHRVKGGGGTYAVGNFSICPDPDLPAFKDRYDVLYPLRDYGFNRQRCGEVIKEAGLPIPPKSACFFCPAMRQIEIQRLAVIDPDLYKLAIEMEGLYRGGHHFRGDDFWTVKAQHKETGEKYSHECFAPDADGARADFRAKYDDTARPYKYKLRAHRAVPGLGRSFAWKDVETQLVQIEEFQNVRVVKP